MKKVLKAIADFQQECPVIHKDTKGFNYTYAGLPQIQGVINPLLKKHGLGFIQPLEGSTIKTILFHIESGETVEGFVEIPQGVKLGAMNDFQVMGSAISYLRRYSIASLLGLITDKDIDASGEQKPNPPTPPEKKPLDNEGLKYLRENGTLEQLNTALNGRILTNVQKEVINGLIKKLQKLQK